jgi:hypothetical protein
MQDSVDQAAAPAANPGAYHRGRAPRGVRPVPLQRGARGGPSYPCGREAPRCGDWRLGEVGAGPGSTAVRLNGCLGSGYVVLPRRPRSGRMSASRLPRTATVPRNSGALAVSASCQLPGGPGVVVFWRFNWSATDWAHPAGLTGTARKYRNVPGFRWTAGYVQER